MAIYHLSVKPISRSAGRTATAAAAYRSGAQITDERSGEQYDYTRKRGVLHTEIVAPADAMQWAQNRAQLWNAAEMSERRKDACTAREYEVALPSELSLDQQRELVREFARGMVDTEGCAIDIAIHAPRKYTKAERDEMIAAGDDDPPEHNGNYHAHMMRTTRKVDAEGMGDKLDTEKAGRKRKADLEAVRGKWGDLVNGYLQRYAPETAPVDHRSLVEQRITDREPGMHLGPAAAGYERRTGQKSRRREEHEAEIEQRLRAAAQAGQQERDFDRQIIDLRSSLAQAYRERDEALKRATDALFDPEPTLTPQKALQTPDWHKATPTPEPQKPRWHAEISPIDRLLQSQSDLDRLNELKREADAERLRQDIEKQRNDQDNDKDLDFDY